MTLCFATWQKGRSKLRLANAGQSQPLLFKDGRCAKVNLTGFPLGLYDDVTYDEWGVTLAPGDILVFHSDGLAEAVNPEGQLYGTDRLRSVLCANVALPAGALADHILADVEQFSRGVPITDDRTLIILKVK